MTKDIEAKINEHILRLMDNLKLFEESERNSLKDLTVQELHTIALVGKMDFPKMSEIASKGRVTKGAVTLMINKLEKKGYLKKVRSDNDRRVVRVELTAEGRAVERKHRKYHERNTAKVMAGLNASEKQNVERALRRILESLN